MCALPQLIFGASDYTTKILVVMHRRSIPGFTYCAYGWKTTCGFGY